MDSTPSPKGRTVLLYDGECGFCQRSVRWLLRHDPSGRLLFAPQHHPLAITVLTRHGLDPAHLNSAVLVTGFDTPAERLSLRSAAILDALAVLGGPWRLLATFARLVPRRLRDTVYSWIARHRLRLFPVMQACELPTPSERARFLSA